MQNARGGMRVYGEGKLLVEPNPDLITRLDDRVGELASSFEALQSQFKVIQEAKVNHREHVFIPHPIGKIRELWAYSRTEVRLLPEEGAWASYPHIVTDFLKTFLQIASNRISRGFCWATNDEINRKMKR